MWYDPTYLLKIFQIIIIILNAILKILVIIFFPK
jgi:hypothetical protein